MLAEAPASVLRQVLDGPRELAWVSAQAECYRCFPAVEYCQVAYRRHCRVGAYCQAADRRSPAGACYPVAYHRHYRVDAYCQAADRRSPAGACYPVAYHRHYRVDAYCQAAVQ
jgi:hypothetical protein